MKNRQNLTQGEADVLATVAGALRQLVDGGFTHESAVAFVASSDPTVLQRKPGP